MCVFCWFWRVSSFNDMEESRNFHWQSVEWFMIYDDYDDDHKNFSFLLLFGRVKILALTKDQNKKLFFWCFCEKCWEIFHHKKREMWNLLIQLYKHNKWMLKIQQQHELFFQTHKYFSTKTFSRFRDFSVGKFSKNRIIIRLP